MTNSILNFYGKKLWVIGGAGYLGQPIVRMLAEAGGTVLCADLADKAKTFVDANNLSTVVPLTVSIDDEKSILRFVDDTMARYGVPDGVVNLAFGSTGKKLEELSEADFDQANHLNLTATFIFSRALATEMVKAEGGSLVLFSSMYGMVSPDPKPYEGTAMNKNPIEYGVGKAGIIQMTKYLAVHYGQKNLRVNCISPGPFPNPTVQQNNPEFVQRLAAKVPMGRFGKQHEIAGTVAFLLSDLSSFITGQNIAVDGGWTSW